MAHDMHSFGSKHVHCLLRDNVFPLYDLFAVFRFLLAMDVLPGNMSKGTSFVDSAAFFIDMRCKYTIYTVQRSIKPLKPSFYVLFDLILRFTLCVNAYQEKVFLKKRSSNHYPLLHLISSNLQIPIHCHSNIYTNDQTT